MHMVITERAGIIFAFHEPAAGPAASFCDDRIAC
jgi:hypothetical protein